MTKFLIITFFFLITISVTIILLSYYFIDGKHPTCYQTENILTSYENTAYAYFN